MRKIASTSPGMIYGPTPEVGSTKGFHIHYNDYVELPKPKITISIYDARKIVIKYFEDEFDIDL